MKKYSNTSWLLGMGLLVVLDQASKLFMVSTYPDFVTYNTGSAFSSPVPRTFVISLSFLILFGILYKQFYLNQKTKHKDLPAQLKQEYYILILIFAGALGNLIDRIRLAKVIDFINLQVWPVFNFADVYLTIAAVLIIWFYLIKRDN